MSDEIRAHFTINNKDYADAREILSAHQLIDMAGYNIQRCFIVLVTNNREKILTTKDQVKVRGRTFRIYITPEYFGELVDNTPEPDDDILRSHNIVYEVADPDIQKNTVDYMMAQVRYNHNITHVYNFFIKLQIEHQHFTEHIHKKMACAKMVQDEDDPTVTYAEQLCYPDPKAIFCPRCHNFGFKGESATDEHDTYIGMRCRCCNFYYSISH